MSYTLELLRMESEQEFWPNHQRRSSAVRPPQPHGTAAAEDEGTAAAPTHVQTGDSSGIGRSPNGPGVQAAPTEAAKDSSTPSQPLPMMSCAKVLSGNALHSYCKLFFKFLKH